MMVCMFQRAWALLIFLCHALLIASKSRNDAYGLLAASIRRNELSAYDVKSISSALKSLSSTQAALKKIDGTAHEMYQRTHKSSTTLEEDDEDEEGSSKIGGLKVKGRMSRNAARVGCVADALFAAELCELVTSPPNTGSDDGTLADWTEREIVFNETIYTDDSADDESKIALSVLVIYEPLYSGGAGVRHGGIEDLLSFAQEEAEDDSGSTQSISSHRGRFIIVLSDHDATSSRSELTDIISTLDQPPIRVKLNRHSNEMASVNGPLYRLAGNLIRSVGEVIDGGSTKKDTESDNEGSEKESDSGATTDARVQLPSDPPAIHIVGHSRAAAVGALAALVLDGSLPMPATEEASEKRWSGFARDRVSALCLGCPPCISNFGIDFITSIINGDDVVCRLSHSTLQRLYSRVERSIKGGILGKGVGWMGDAARLTVTGLTSGSSKKQDTHLAVPGRVYLIRPRRLGGGSSSIHDIAGRENFRAAVLWQLNDVLLSKSLWKHHEHSSYIRSLDRVQLKGFSDHA